MADNQSIDSIIKQIGRTDSKRINFVTERIAFAANTPNCATAALCLLGHPTEDSYAGYFNPMQGLWEDSCKLVFFKKNPTSEEKIYQLFNAISTVDELLNKQGYFANFNNGGFLINFGENSIFDPVQLYVRSTKDSNLEYLVDPFTQLKGHEDIFWQKLNSLLNDKEVISILSYRNKRGILDLGQFHQSILIKVSGNVYIIEKSIQELMSIKQLNKLNFLEKNNPYKLGIHFLVTDSEQMLGLPKEYKTGTDNIYTVLDGIGGGISILPQDRLEIRAILNKNIKDQTLLPAQLQEVYKKIAKDFLEEKLEEIKRMDLPEHILFKTIDEFEFYLFVEDGEVFSAPNPLLYEREKAEELEAFGKHLLYREELSKKQGGNYVSQDRICLPLMFSTTIDELDEAFSKNCEEFIKRGYLTSDEVPKLTDLFIQGSYLVTEDYVWKLRQTEKEPDTPLYIKFKGKYFLPENPIPLSEIKVNFETKLTGIIKNKIAFYENKINPIS